MALIASALAAAATGCASTSALTPADEVPLMTLAAHGVQIYECRAAQGAAPAWAFVAPEADLFDGTGRRIGKHGAGPFWQHEDGSRFTGTVRSRMDSPRAGAIPWLLLTAKNDGPAGAFARVSSVQRIETVGGQPPADGCSAGALGQRVNIAYRADYVLHVPRL
ncbi:MULTISPECIES: DUF3455 domain-containing protein [unclassified Polaromonas]|uniref:DUF3455 domain-containing protein n=1 Tax=unclassified Polaromonas TaxID=2638319 RepID=UPI000F0938DF|nr:MULTISPECIES: DUF3455 domain-containing protein [unclassified Polaromonas]AYQ28660.1 DUF3455 domain-containing protein [Polaromonas sp. SP1]QGJ20223.1 DUF3455 domain-containing protein [Polaromonas sp. Pch-P]